MCCTCLQACLFLFSVCLLVLLVILLFHSTTRFKWRARQKLATVFSLPVIWNRYRLAVRFLREYMVHGHTTTSSHHSKWEQSSGSSFNSSNGKWSAFYYLKNSNGDHLILCLMSLAKLKRICTQFAWKMHRWILTLGNNWTVLCERK